MAIWGGPASWLGKQPGAPHSGPHTSVCKSLMCVWTEGQNSVSSTRAPHRGPLTSGESVITAPLRALAALQPCAATRVSPREPSRHLRRRGTAHSLFIGEDTKGPEVKPSAQGHRATEWQSQIEPRTVCSQSQNSNLTRQPMWQVAKSMGRSQEAWVRVSALPRGHPNK